jgi:hypothetical protein
MKVEAPISRPPQSYMDLIEPLIAHAKNLLESGEKLHPIAFVGNLTTKQIVAVLIQANSEQSKDQSAAEIKTSAMSIEADFVFTIMEAWSLRPDKVAQVNVILDKYGSIGASPYAIDTCSFMLESHRGSWVAQPQIKPKGVSKKKRTIGTAEFRFYNEVQGRFVQLLPLKDRASMPSGHEEKPSIFH